MDLLDILPEVMSLVSRILLEFFNAQHSLQVSLGSWRAEEWLSDGLGVGAALAMDMSSPAMDMMGVMNAALRDWWLWNSTLLSTLDEDLGFWVKPRSTIWVSRFLLQEHNDEHWVQMFRMPKRSVVELADLLKPSIQKKDTNCRSAVPVLVKLVCTLFKLSHGASLLVCSEMFAVGRSTVSGMLRDVVHAINDALRSEISWPKGERLQATAASFQQLCGLPGVAGAIGGTHFAISKPELGDSDYDYFKSGGFSMNCQAVVDCSKRFLDLYVGQPGSMNNARMLRRSSLFKMAQRHVLWDPATTFNGFSPYLLGDSGYPLLPWLMVPRTQQGELSMVEALFNEKLSRGRCVVEDTFTLLKQSFKELDDTSDLSVTFLPDVVVCCALLHNLLQGQSQQDVDVLHTEIAAQDLQREGAPADEVPEADGDRPDFAPRKRRRLSLFVAV